ncbi:MAG: HAMP domain-containing protein [Anaerolineales bacterium]|nr:MAG: HAMP domain-containing protein [Anaerolineales bacterium]
MKNRSATEQAEPTISATTGMQGGLGRTLLAAFLVLAIVPMSTISFIAVNRTRQDMRQELMTRLTAVATLKEAQIQRWITERSRSLAVLSSKPDVQQAAMTLLTQHPSSAAYDAAYTNLRDSLRAELMQDTGFAAFLLRGEDSDEPLLEVMATHKQVSTDTTWPEVSLTSDGHHVSLSSVAPTLNVTYSIPGPEGEALGLLIGRLDITALDQIMTEPTELGEMGETYLVTPAGQSISALATDANIPLPVFLHSQGIDAALAEHGGSGLYDNYAGQPVIGAYRWLPELQAALLAEQAQAEAFAPEDRLATMLVGTTLAVALLTTLLAAVVTRQITRPIVLLTMRAVRIANGDLEQTVPVDRRDEIGILARAFNIMTAELRALYNGLEQKVAERTTQLREANRRVRYRAMQLAVSAEVGRVATSILDLDVLLSRVVELIRDYYRFTYVAIFLLDDTGQWAVLREGSGELGDTLKAKGQWLSVGEPSLVGQVAEKSEPRVLSKADVRSGSSFHLSSTHSEAAFPLRIGGRTLGVLDIHSPHADAFDEDDVKVLQGIADQIAIAIENARAYELEREAARQLREAEEMRRRFLAHMSHELREPLTNIIGFSRVILKGIDGPISDQQRSDLEIVYANGQHLLGLINDLLDVAQIEAGLMELEFKEVDLRELIHSVMATISALVRDKDIQLQQEIHPELPPIEADGTRLRQVLLKLLSNAAKFTDRGSITVGAWPNGNQVQVTVADTGRGIPEEDHERVFERFEQGESGVKRPQGIGVGLALCKEFVEMHGGRIWVESQEEVGSTFTFTLPIRRQ